MRKFLMKAGIVLTMLVVVAGLATAGGGSEAATAKEPMVIKYFGIRSFPGTMVIKEMLEDQISERLGRPITFELLGGVSDQELHSTIDMRLAANDLPDFFQRFNIDPEFLTQAATKFTLDTFKENSPQYAKRLVELMDQLNKDPAKTWAIYQDPADGMMWGMPRIWEWGWIPSGQMWRQDILDDLGYEIPTTIAEAEEVFEAYKAVYPNKFALTGRGKTDWQCFDVVFNAFGISGGDTFLRDGVLKQFYATREFREALIVLRRWYEKGFWDTEFLNHNLEWVQNFAAGNYLVTQWIKDWDFYTGEKTAYLEPLRNVPGATAVAATHIAADSNTKPAQRVWDPFLPQLTVMAKHLESDPEKLEVIMQIGDLIGMDGDIKWLAGFGIEGTHYIIPEGETVPLAIAPAAGLPLAEVTDKYGFGYYWTGAFGGAGALLSRTAKLYDEFVMTPGAPYSQEKITYVYPIVNGAVTDEAGNPVQVTMPSSWFQMTVDIMTGVQPIEYYDEWIEAYYDGGGRAWETHATRLWVK